MNATVRIALVLPDNHVGDVLAAPDAALWRMARQKQAQALAAGLDGQVEVRLDLLPRRDVPSLAGSLRWELCANGHRMLETLPTAALQPLVAGPAAALRRAAELPEDAAISYVVLMPDPPGPAWQAQLPAFKAVTAAAPPGRPLFPGWACPGDAPVRVRQAVLAEAAAYCLDPQVEKGGVLLGCLCRDGNGLNTEVLAFAPAVGAKASATSLTFNVAAWQSIERQRVAAQKALGLAQPLQVLGWIHGHPRIEELGPFFLSSHDTAIMAQHFAEPFAVAVVVDAAAEPGTPLDQVLAVFGWDEHGVGLTLRSLDVLDDAIDERRMTS